MKKMLVKILCRLKLWEVAHAISPSLAWYYADIGYYKGVLWRTKYKMGEEASDK